MYGIPPETLIIRAPIAIWSGSSPGGPTLLDKRSNHVSLFLFYGMIASVHILYSSTLKVYYSGFTTISVEDRLKRHLEEYYDNK